MNKTVLGARYLLGPVIAKGGAGSVHEGIDLRTGGRVAVKLLHGVRGVGEQGLGRLRREASVLAQLDSPRIVRLLDLDTDRDTGQVYLVQEFVPGETLSARLRRDAPLPMHEALRIAREIAFALGSAHDAGVFHRDLKPSNIMLANGAVKVLDFGAARAPDATLTLGMHYSGTPAYSAPEQVDGQADARSDIYALGVVLYEMLTGARPFDAPTPLALLRLHRSEPPPPLPATIPRALRRVVECCLEKAPERRYGTARELVTALDQVVRTPTQTTPAATLPAISPTTAAPPTARSSSGRAWNLLLPAMFAVVALGVAAGGWSLYSRQESSTEGRIARSIEPAAGAPSPSATAAATPSLSAATGLMSALLAAPFRAGETPLGAIAGERTREEVTESDRQFGAVGRVSVSITGAGDFGDAGLLYTVYPTPEAARARLEQGYSGSASLVLNGTFAPAGVPEPARGLTATIATSGRRSGISFCIALVDEVEIRGSSARAAGTSAGTNDAACRLVAGGVAHLQRVRPVP